MMERAWEIHRQSRREYGDKKESDKEIREEGRIKRTRAEGRRKETSEVSSVRRSKRTFFPHMEGKERRKQIMTAERRGDRK